MLVDLSTHQPSLLGKSGKCSRYGIHCAVLLLDQQLQESGLFISTRMTEYNYLLVVLPFPIDFLRECLPQVVNKNLMARIIVSCWVLTSVHMGNRLVSNATNSPKSQSLQDALIP